MLSDEVPVAYFHCPTDDHDVSRFKFERGGSEGQQVCEALAMLVGLRLWAKFWQDGRATIEVTGDSISALTLVLYCRTKSTATNIIAREIALDVAESIYRPDVGTHIPGTMNVAADQLSRIAQPGHSTHVPPILATACRDVPPLRDDAYYRASGAPSAPASHSGQEGEGRRRIKRRRCDEADFGKR